MITQFNSGPPKHTNTGNYGTAGASVPELVAKHRRTDSKDLAIPDMVSDVDASLGPPVERLE